MKKIDLLFIAVGLLVSCNGEQSIGGGNDTIKKNQNTSVTVGYDHVSAISAVLNGKANLGAYGTADLTIGFQYSKTEGILPSNATTIEVSDADSDYNYSADITGLEPDTKYYFRSFVRQNGQDTYGETKSFTTKELLSMLETIDAADVERTKASMRAKLNLNDVIFESSAYGFLWGQSKDAMNTVVECTEIVKDTISTVLIHLSHGTKYWYKAYAKIGNQTYYGEAKTFTTTPYTAVAGEAVDLGLSVKWSSMNLGATSPTDYGDYFAWGETVPKDIYSWDTYELCNGSSTTLTKYKNSSSYGSVDNKTEFEDYNYEDDAARQALGGKWRIPSTAEFDELKEQCTWIGTTQNGVNGILGTSIINGNSIFLPSAGYSYYNSYLGHNHDALVGNNGYYWSSSCSNAYEPRYALFLTFNSHSSSGSPSNSLSLYVHPWGEQRAYGLQVRPVTE